MSLERAWVLAVTGGIAAGKSTVTRQFEALGVPIHDADSAARSVVSPGSQGLGEVVAAFGAEILDAGGQLDRGALRRLIFADPSARARLEAILHPKIRQHLQAQVAARHQPYAIVAIPLLAEHREAYRWVQRILVVDIEPALQLQRLRQRDGLSGPEAERIIASQATPQQRLAIADDVLHNNGEPVRLAAEVARLHQHYLQLASQNTCFSGG